MTNLRFKEYVFRHNPARLKVSRCQKVSRSCCYGVGEHLQLLGNGLTVVEGEGELFGADALEQFYALQRLDRVWVCSAEQVLSRCRQCWKRWRWLESAGRSWWSIGSGLWKKGKQRDGAKHFCGAA